MSLSEKTFSIVGLELKLAIFQFLIFSNISNNNKSRAGKTTYKVALDMLTFTEKDTDSLVWSMALDNLSFLDNLLGSTDSYTMFRVNISLSL